MQQVSQDLCHVTLFKQFLVQKRKLLTEEKIYVVLVKWEETPWWTSKTKRKVKSNTKQMWSIFRLFWNWSRAVCYGLFCVKPQHKILSSPGALRSYGKTLPIFLDFEEIGELRKSSKNNSKRTWRERKFFFFLH